MRIDILKKIRKDELGATAIGPSKVWAHLHHRKRQILGRPPEEVGGVEVVTMDTPTPNTALEAEIDRANWHHHRGDEFVRTAGTSHRPQYWLNRASIAYALASVIILGMKDEGHG